MPEVNALITDPSNAGQLRAWDGDEGAYWAANADHFDRAVAAYHDRLLAAADVQAADQVLDVGCGTGQTTRHAARAAVSGSALGVDLSSQMLDLARSRAAQDGVANARFEQADAQIYPFQPATFDVAISRTGAMFFGDLTAAFTNIARALRRGGRLVLLTWQGPGGNEWIRELSTAMAAGRDLPDPPTGRARAVLTRRPRPGAGRPRRRRVHRHPARASQRGDVVRRGCRRRAAVRARLARLDA